ncbi:DsbA family protein [Propionicicella superfundia]|uniref:DsbA family protein n=1 Tax=Propionicicella superfundia TaxID=348582 RepID=UPI00041A6F52|nr:thioredoxin domain-containing protein [Propionicicella superfundia]
MAKKPNKPNPSGGSRRELLRQQQEKAARERRTRNIITFSIVGVVVVALVATLVYVIVSAFNQQRQTANPVASGATSEYVLTVGEASAPVTIDIYQDYMCPYCGQFERTNTSDLQSLVSDATAKVQLHPMAFLDESSNGTKFSTRAANALVTVYNNEPDKTLAMNAILFANQPAEGTDGLSDDQIADFAAQAGVSETTINLFKSQLYADWVGKATQAAFDEGVDSTPTIKINGEKFSGDLYTAGVLKAAAQEAASK